MHYSGCLIGLHNSLLPSGKDLRNFYLLPRKFWPLDNLLLALIIFSGRCQNALIVAAQMNFGLFF